MIETLALSVRLPQPIRDHLRHDAEQNDRSMNAELVQILKAHFGLKAPAKVILKAQPKAVRDGNL